METRAVWIKEGRPRDKSNTVFINYKEAKKIFRKQQRRNAYEYEKKSMKELASTQELDQKYFWYRVNKNKRALKSISPIVGSDGEILTNVDDIRSDWNLYYKDLYSSHAIKAENQNFAQHILSEVECLDNELCPLETLEDGPITIQETTNEIMKMKNRKAPGWDMVTNEHLKNSGNLAIATITWLMNNIVKSEIIPLHYKRGLIVSIPKPAKDITIKDNNRGITPTTIFYKLLEKIIQSREKKTGLMILVS